MTRLKVNQIKRKYKENKENTISKKRNLEFNTQYAKIKFEEVIVHLWRIIIMNI